MLWSWQNADISANEKYNGDFEKSLNAIKARAVVMPCKTDLYFPPEDSEYEVKHMPNAELRPMQSIWGHLAGGPGFNPEDTGFLDGAVRELLAT
jgi:homoserine O-acetyltransferase